MNIFDVRLLLMFSAYLTNPSIIYNPSSLRQVSIRIIRLRSIPVATLFFLGKKISRRIKLDNSSRAFLGIIFTSPLPSSMDQDS